ncbi:MAG TPA: NAD(P)H-binding protein [Catenuloplanes sp.]
MTRVLVTGATGTLGSAVLPRLPGGGFQVLAMSRRPRATAGAQWRTADLSTGAGLAEAVAGVDAVVHLATAGRQMAAVDVAGTGRLIDAAAAAGVRQLLYVSIVGIDRVPMPYYRAKLAAEDLVRAGRLPWTILRATQFSQLVDRFLVGTTRLGVLPADRNVLVQPVHPGDVAGRIATLLAQGPADAILEYGGPRMLRFGDIVAQWRQARGSRRPVLPVRIPGRVGAALRAGALTTTAQPAGTRSWQDYLAGTAPARR